MDRCRQTLVANAALKFTAKPKIQTAKRMSYHRNIAAHNQAFFNNM